MQSRNPWAAGLALLLASSVGCLPHAVERSPRPPVRTPRTYASASDDRALQRPTGTEPRPSVGAPKTVAEPASQRSRPPAGGWRKRFGDRELDTVVDLALRNGFELRTAWARLEQARGLQTQAQAPLWPQLNAEASAGIQRFLSPVSTATFLLQRYSLSLAASYEVDLFRRIGSSARAAELEAVAARDDLDTAAMSLVAQIVEAYFSLADVRARGRILRSQLESNEQFATLARLRFEQGLANAIDVSQQNQQVIATRAQLALIAGQERAAFNQLAILVGMPPNALAMPAIDALPEVAALPDAGVPADLLRNRPDVRAARRRVEAADYRVGAAFAEHFPTLNVGGTVGFNSREARELFNRFVWSAVAQVSAPIFVGGRIRGGVEVAEGVLRERVELYGQVLVQAISEVDNALALERHQRTHLDELQKQLTAATETLEAARLRYTHGLSDFLPVLTSIQAQQQAELALLSGRRQMLSYRIQLHRALGGRWPEAVASRSRGPRPPID